MDGFGEALSDGGTAKQIASGLPPKQRKAIKDELGEQKELARLEKERRRAARAAEEAAAEAARN